MSIRAKIIKRLLRSQMSGWADGSVEEQRIRQNKSVQSIKLPANTHCQPVDVNGVPAEWIESPDVTSGVFLYLHGGAYSIGSITSHRELIARLAHATGMRGLAINYRLAPEDPYPAALEDALTAYRWLLSEGIDASKIIIIGDSAGGGLALALLSALSNTGESLPAGAVCLSPWADLTNSGASFQSKANRDPYLTFDILEMYAGYYAGEQDRKLPLISPLYADFSDFPPLLIHAGSDEVLLDDATRVAEKADKAGVDVTLKVWDGLFHVFSIISFLPESKKAMENIAQFTAVCVSGDSE